MKRRDFLLGIGAVSAAPLTPLPVYSALAQDTGLYLKAVTWSGVCDYSSVHVLQYQFGLSDHAAQGLFDRLVANKIVSVPDPSGTSRVILTTYKSSFTAKKLEDVLPSEEPLQVTKKVNQVSSNESSSKTSEFDAHETTEGCEISADSNLENEAEPPRGTSADSELLHSVDRVQQV
jgi:hypothetical protein